MSQQDQLEDLQRRFQLLEGERKATFETAKLNIQQNKEIMKQMKVENGKLRQQIGDLRNGNPPSQEKRQEAEALEERLKALNNQIIQERTAKPGALETQQLVVPMKQEMDQLRFQLTQLRKPEGSTEAQVEGKMTNVQLLQRRCDTLCAENTKKQAHLDDLSGTIAELGVNSQLHKTEASPQMRQIRVLENRLDKVMIKFNEAQSIRKTYEAIEKRLKEERIGFDNQLAAIERTLKAKERDYEELLLLSHNAYHAKEMAQAELHRFEQGVMEERNQRDKEVRDKKALVQQRIEMNNRLENRERMLKKQSELEKESDKKMKELAATTTLTSGIHSDYAQEERQKLVEYEDAMNRIKEATGVGDVNEVIQKFLTQEDTFKSLVQLTDDNRKKIEQLTEDRRKVRHQVEELKFTSGGNVGRRTVIDQFEKDLAEATEKLDRNKAKFERVAKQLISTKAGIGHLADKLEPIKLEGETQQLDMSDENVEEILQRCEMKLSQLTRLVHRLDDPESRGRALRVDDDRYEEKLLSKSQSDIRVKLGDAEPDGEDDDADDFDEDEDVWNRRHVKYSSDQIMERQKTKERKKNKKKPTAAA